MQKKLLTLLAFLFVPAKGDPVNFKLCTDIQWTGLVSNVLISECKSLPCVFEKGKTYSIEIDFENFRDTSTLTAEVYGILGGVAVPWPGLDKNACNGMLVGRCPLYNGDYVTYGLTVPVALTFPSVSATLRWLLVGDDNRPIFCFELPVRLI